MNSRGLFDCLVKWLAPKETELKDCSSFNSQCVILNVKLFSETFFKIMAINKWLWILLCFMQSRMLQIIRRDQKSPLSECNTGTARLWCRLLQASSNVHFLCFASINLAGYQTVLSTFPLCVIFYRTISRRNQIKCRYQRSSTWKYRSYDKPICWWCIIFPQELTNLTYEDNHTNT